MHPLRVLYLFFIYLSGAVDGRSLRIADNSPFPPPNGAPTRRLYGSPRNVELMMRNGVPHVNGPPANGAHPHASAPFSHAPIPKHDSKHLAPAHSNGSHTVDMSPPMTVKKKRVYAGSSEPREHTVHMKSNSSSYEKEKITGFIPKDVPGFESLRKASNDLSAAGERAGAGYPNLIGDAAPATFKNQPTKTGALGDNNQAGRFQEYKRPAPEMTSIIVPETAGHGFEDLRKAAFTANEGPGSLEAPATWRDVPTGPFRDDNQAATKFKPARNPHNGKKPAPNSALAKPSKPRQPGEKLGVSFPEGKRMIVNHEHDDYVKNLSKEQLKYIEEVTAVGYKAGPGKKLTTREKAQLVLLEDLMELEDKALRGNLTLEERQQIKALEDAIAISEMKANEEMAAKAKKASKKSKKKAAAEKVAEKAAAEKAAEKAAAKAKKAADKLQKEAAEEMAEAIAKAGLKPAKKVDGKRLNRKGTLQK